MFVGKLDVFNAPTVHLDEVDRLPPGTTVLASNAMSSVQAVEIRTNGSVAWAVQYHPEYPLTRAGGHRAPYRHRVDEEAFLSARPTSSASPTTLNGSTAIPAANGCPGGTASAIMCSTKSCG